MAIALEKLEELMVLCDEDESILAECEEFFGGRLDAVAAAYSQVARAQALLAEQLAAAQKEFARNERIVLAEGHRSPAADAEIMRRAFTAEIATGLRVSERAASGLIHESETLVNELPATHAALASGEISYQHARTTARQAWSVPVEGRAEFDRQATVKAKVQTASRFGSTARKLRERLHPESIETRVKQAVSFRKVEFTPEEDGMAWVGVYHTADVATAIHQQVRDLAVRRKNETPGEERTLTQLGADLFAEALLSQLGQETIRTGPFDPVGATGSAGSGLTAAQLAALRPNVTITVPALTLLGQSDQPAELHGYGPIDIDTAVELVGQATSFIRVLTDPVDGSTIGIDPTKYRLSEQMKRLIRTRDGTCGFPGCDEPAENCDIDHTVAWEDGGRSSPDNLACLCRKHHVLKHASRWTVTQEPGGTLVWTSPAGARYTTIPGHR